MPDAAQASSAIDLVIYALTVAAGLSLVIERILEVFKHFTDFESKRGDEGKRSQQVKRTLKEAYDSAQSLKKALLVYKTNRSITDFAASIEPAHLSAIPSRQPAQVEDMDESEAGFEQHHAIKVFPIPTPSLTQIKQRAFLQLAAAGLGIAAAEAFDVRLVGLIFESFRDQRLMDTLVTGLIIGGGSQPIHVLLRFLTTRRVDIEQERQRQAPVAKKKTQPLAEATTKPEGRLITIDYDGGVDRDKLQNRNLRPGNPTKVVYHHTAMHHENSFQAVVDEITKIKQWSTGYHCVIMPDGEIEFFCRWDRVGNHAYGANQESLGIAFHGNFHTQGQDQFSNYNGQFGNQEPTEAQIAAGARVIALWAHIYQIPLDFSSGIMPHYLVKPTACPGSNFPHEKLQQCIKTVYQSWETGKAQQEIKQYKDLPYVFA